MSTGEPTHRPVLLSETLRYLAPEAGECMADGTVGLGGHAAPILSRLGPTGFLLGIDRDAEALAIAEKRLAGIGGAFRLVHGEFTRLKEFLEQLGRPPEEALDGFLLDLGVSSLQLDRRERGFSFLKDGPLDMRMDPGEGESAAEYLTRVSVSELESVLRRYGEERWARRIAVAVGRLRRREELRSTAQLARLVEETVPAGGRRQRRIHPATRTFQAVRIVVNGELELLRRVLRDLDRFMRPGGRVVVLSYHSLEDRIVKQILGEREKEGLYRAACRGVVRPSPEEVEENPRARSARLRAYVRGTEN